MAKTTKSPDQDGEISVTMFKLTVKGSDTSLQKGLDTIKAAMVQAGFVAAVPEARQLRSNGGAAPPVFPVAAEDDRDGEVVDVETNEEETASSTPSRKSSTPRKAPNYQVLQELTFEDASPTLPEFVGQKDPQTDWDKYKCIAYWFKHYKATPDLTVEHFYTAYLFLDWKTPPNPYQPTKDLRKKKSFSIGQDRGTVTINNVGERQVRELKKDAA
jgi:hypothetical protein